MDNYTDNKKLLEQMEESYKAMTTQDFGVSIIQPEYFDKYVECATRNTTILADARQIIMNSSVVNIDRVGFTGRILTPGQETVDVERSKPATAQERLVASELVADAAITDQSLRRNIERGGFEDTLMTMMGLQSGKDWESYAVLGNTNYTNDDKLLKSNNGWIAKAKTHIYGDGTDFDANATDKPVTKMMKKMIQAYPQEYRGNRRDLRFYLDSEMFDDYIDEVGERPTVQGDDTVFNYIAKPYKGIEVREAPVLNECPNLDIGASSMLVNPDNLVYGIFEQVTVERERQARQRLTDFILTMEVDQCYENSEVAVIAHTDIGKDAGDNLFPSKP